jgi:hypothetical protein
MAPLGSLKSSFWSVFVALLAALVTMVGFRGLTMVNDKSLDNLRKFLDDPRSILVFAAAIIILLLPLVVEFLQPAFIRRFFGRGGKDKD